MCKRVQLPPNKQKVATDVADHTQSSEGAPQHRVAADATAKRRRSNESALRHRVASSATVHTWAAAFTHNWLPG